MNLLVSPVRCCAAMCAAEQQANDSKRDGTGLRKEF